MLLGFLGFSINYTRVLHTGRLPLKSAYCVLYVCVCFIGALPQIKKYVKQVEKSFL